MRLSAPGHWQHGGSTLLSALLSPLAYLVAARTAARVAQPGWRAPVPVVCCGNAGVGGAGKTTLALDLCTRLQARGMAVHVLTRGHGGSARGPLRVDPARHTARDVGDEALLLAARAPTWVGADRAATGRAAVADGATILLMDDGLQNPTLEKTASFLVIDGGAGFGNARVLPAGPLRESVETAASRCACAVLVGEDSHRALALLPRTLPVLRARLRPGPELAGLTGQRVLAFAGIGRPAKFFDMLEAEGLRVVRRMPFPDHHQFSPADLARITASARDLDARAVTTPKDHVRIAPDESTHFIALGVALAWEDEAALTRWLTALAARLVAGSTQR